MTISLSRRAALASGLAAGLALAALPASGQDKPVLRFSAVFSDKDIRAEMMRQFGEAVAPEFTLPDHTGTPRSLSDYRGRWVVLWWFPKAFTSG